MMCRYLRQSVRLPVILTMVTVLSQVLGAATHRVDADAVWQPEPAAVAGIQRQCAASIGPSHLNCFSRHMEDAGASPAAVAFLRSTDGAYLRRLQRVGPFDVAYVRYPFRANENDGILLVNHSPERVDVDDAQLLPRMELAQHPVYAGLARQYPQLSIWPGERGGATGLVIRKLPDRGRRFVADYRLRNQCHACAVVGAAQVGFDFDSSGRFLGTTLLQVTAAP